MTAPPDEARSAYYVRAVDRACDLLAALGRSGGKLNLGRLAAAAGLTPPTTLRLAQNLVRRGLLEYDHAAGLYSLGPEIVRLAGVRLSSTDIRQQALPILQALRDDTGETAVLSVRAGPYRIHIEQAESPQPVRRVVHIGEAEPIHRGAPAKVLLANLPDADREAILRSLASAGPEQSVAIDRLSSELATIRAARFAVSFEETGAGGAAVASPVWDAGGAVVASISVVAPVVRLDPDRAAALVPRVCRAAEELSRRLGAPAVPQATDPATGPRDGEQGDPGGAQPAQQVGFHEERRRTAPRRDRRTDH